MVLASKKINVCTYFVVVVLVVLQYQRTEITVLLSFNFTDGRTDRYIS